TNKYVIEHMLRDMSNHRGFNSICLRYFNPVGAHSSGLIGEDPNDIPNNLLPFIMKVASGELKEINIFGDDYNTPDGTGVRDYIHVVDLVKGHLKAWEWMKNNSQNGHIEYINLGTGNGTSVLEMVNYTSEIVGKKLPYSIVPRRTGDLASSYCIADKAKNILNWEAKLSVKQAIKDSWNFIQKK
ncbi:NAD-dependent epimerase/dehydratase family protein, partial [Candidatus Gracilibacteria bacterium]|nr:NAD-dependent epimerase/dehydratase family protein [Candidatus Gracilibacteria bacterium]